MEPKKTKVARFQLKDGRIAKFEVPADATREQIEAYADDYFSPKGGETGFNARNPQSVMVNPVEGMGYGEAALAGAGARVMDKVLGLKQRLGLASEQDVMEKRGRDAPLMKTPGASVGAFAADVAPWVVANPASLVGNLAMGAVLGATEPTAPGESVGMNMINQTGGAGIGYGTNRLVGAILGPAAKTQDPARMSSIAYAESKGIPMTAGQQTGGSFMQRMERQLAGLPGASGWFKRINDKAQSAVNDIVEKMTGDVKQRYTNFAKGKEVVIDQQFLNDIAALPNKFAGTGKKLQPNTALEVVDDIVKGNNPVIQAGNRVPMGGPVGDFNNVIAMRSYINELGNRTTDSVDKSAYRAIVSAMDDMIERQFPNSGYKDLRASYFVDRFVAKARDEQGNVSLAHLKNKVKAKDAEGKAVLNNLGAKGDELRQLAKLAPYLQPVNTSGTAENLLALKVATGGLGLGTAGYIYGDLSGNDLAKMLGSGLIGVGGGLFAAPWLINQMMQGRQAGILANPALRRASAGTTQGILNNTLQGITIPQE